MHVAPRGLSGGGATVQRPSAPQVGVASSRQSALLAQRVRQEVPSAHARPPGQGVATGVEQAPAPLQAAALVTIPAAHRCGAQITLAPGAVQAAVPVAPSTQVAPHAPAGPHDRWPGRGLPLIGAQTPGFAPSQAWQLPAQALLQQTPSAQKPEPHSINSVHGVPLDLVPQDPPWQIPTLQSALVVHVPEHLPVLAAHR